MELQWPLILFTSFLAASAGLFATQCVYSLRGQGEKAQLPSLVVSAVFMVVGGIAVFLHLQHWERIFNGFGHITSGITQELIAVVLLAVVMVIYFVMLRKGEIKKPLAIVGIIISAVLVLVMGLSYLMAAHPTWDSVLQVLSLYGLAVAFGPGAFALIQAASNKTEETTGEAPENSLTSLLTLVGSAAGLVLTLAFIAAMSFGSTQLVSVGNYFDPNHPTTGMLTSDLYSPFATGTVGITIASIVCAVVALAFAVYGRKSGKWLVAGAGIAVFALAAGVLLRAVFFATGGSVFMFY